jgi:hypothetical protein
VRPEATFLFPACCVATDPLEGAVPELGMSIATWTAFLNGEEAFTSEPSCELDFGSTVRRVLLKQVPA